MKVEKCPSPNAQSCMHLHVWNCQTCVFMPLHSSQDFYVQKSTNCANEDCNIWRFCMSNVPTYKAVIHCRSPVSAHHDWRVYNVLISTWKCLAQKQVSHASVRAAANDTDTVSSSPEWEESLWLGAAWHQCKSTAATCWGRKFTHAFVCSWRTLTIHWVVFN